MRGAPLLPMIGFALAVLFVVACLHLYLYRRLVRDLVPSRRGRQLGALAVALAAALLVAGPVASRAHPSGWQLWLGRVSYLWWGLAFYLFVLLLAADVVRAALRLSRHARTAARPAAPPAPAPAPPAPPAAPAPSPSSSGLPPSSSSSSSAAAADPSRRVFLARSTALAASVATAGITGYGVVEAFGVPEVTEVPVRLAGLPAALSGLTIVQLTDLHVGAWVDRGFVAEVVARTNALRPDAVVITGDLVDGSVEDLAPKVAPLASLRSRFGTFFITGNHELYSGADAWCAFLASPRMGMTVLRNACATLGEPGGAAIDLLGVDDWAARLRGYPGGYDLGKALACRDPSRPAILLAHQPRDEERAAAAGIGLQLSGHTHGGQIWPWSYAVRLAYPRYSGRYQIGEMTLYVSRGCGFWGPPVRVGAPPEIVRVTLG